MSWSPVLLIDYKGHGPPPIAQHSWLKPTKKFMSSTWRITFSQHFFRVSAVKRRHPFSPRHTLLLRSMFTTVSRIDSVYHGNRPCGKALLCFTKENSLAKFEYGFRDSECPLHPATIFRNMKMSWLNNRKKYCLVPSDFDALSLHFATHVFNSFNDELCL